MHTKVDWYNPHSWVWRVFVVRRVFFNFCFVLAKVLKNTWNTYSIYFRLCLKQGCISSLASVKQNSTVTSFFNVCTIMCVCCRVSMWRVSICTLTIRSYLDFLISYQYINSLSNWHQSYYFSMVRAVVYRLLSIGEILIF